MSKSRSRTDIPASEQSRAWSDWTLRARETKVGAGPLRQAALAMDWIRARAITEPRILDAGCGSGWLSSRLAEFGPVVGVDLASDALERARSRYPQVRFLAGDLLSIPLEGSFDVIVSLEVLAHVADQRALIERFAKLLVPSGILILATQNRPVYERWSDVGSPMPGTIRQWVDARDLRRLLARGFQVEELLSICPAGDRGVLRALNAPKLNALAALAVGSARLERWKERAGFGRTLVVLARRSQSGQAAAQS